MFKKLKLKSFVFIFLTIIAIFSTAFIMPSNVNAQSYIFDNFYSLPLKPAANAKWWLVNWGAAPDGSPLRVEDYCGDATCIGVQNQGYTNFVRLSQAPNQVAGYYYNAEMAELHTGFAYGEATQWNPTPGHPVIMSARVRWSSNYQADGSGNAVGSTGLWLWNSPVDLVGGNFYGANAIGFQWTPSNSILAQGLNAGEFFDNFPSEQDPINVNMSNWNLLTLVWSENQNGSQSVSYFANSQFLGKHDLPSPLENLSVEIWNDNQRPTYEGIVYDQATETQNFDIDFITVAKI